MLDALALHDRNTMTTRNYVKGTIVPKRWWDEINCDRIAVRLDQAITFAPTVPLGCTRGGQSVSFSWERHRVRTVHHHVGESCQFETDCSTQTSSPTSNDCDSFVFISRRVLFFDTVSCQFAYVQLPATLMAAFSPFWSMTPWEMSDDGKNESENSMNSMLLHHILYVLQRAGISLIGD
jgi:hypothetical protein